MTQAERREYLIAALLKEQPQYSEMIIPADGQEQKNLLRALMNVREPKPISKDFLNIQDEYLQEENARCGIVNADTLPATEADKRLALWQGDITTLKCGAIVNAANSQMCGCFRPLHNCVDNIIHTKAGISLRLKCFDIMCKQGHEEPAGSAKITPAYNLPCGYIIHTVGPIVQDKLTDRDCELLASCYRSCLELAETSGIKSVAFCCISTGVFGFPNAEAAEIAVRTVREYLDGHSGIDRVIFNVFKDIDLKIYQKILGGGEH